jgi:hypothetical protein
MGLWLLDNANLEELSQECEKRNRYFKQFISCDILRYEFMINVNPLNMEGTTGSPVNPIAIF